MSPWLLPAIFLAALLGLCALAYLGGAAFRTWNLTRCWSCGAAKVRPSIARSLLDRLVLLLLLQPYRCAGCRIRFYGFRTFSIGPRLPRIKVIIRLPTFAAWKRSWREGFTEPSESLR
jgi:hypothetical protein